MTDIWLWRNCRDIGIAIHFWPLTWRFGFRRTADLYGGEWSISVGPICLTLSANIGNCSSENRFEAWLGLSEAEAAERAVRECARITAPEITDAEYEAIRKDKEPRYLNTCAEMRRALVAYLGEADEASIKPGPSDSIPSQPDEREAIARIINPKAFDESYWARGRQREKTYALERAAAILAMQEERRGSDPLAAPIKTAPIAGLEPVAWQSRQRFNLERMAMGNIGGWSQCSSDEAMDHWARRPDFEYRGLFTRAQLEAHAAEQVRPLVEALKATLEEIERVEADVEYSLPCGDKARAAIRARGQV